MLLAWLVLAGLGWAVYRGAGPNPFYLDDGNRIAENHHLLKLWPIGRFFTDPETLTGYSSMLAYAPLPPLTMAVDCHLAGGLDPVALRRTNVLLLALVAVLGGWLVAGLVRAGRAEGEAEPDPTLVGAGVALLVLLHPVSGFTVHYVYTRDMLLMSVGMLLGQRAYLALATGATRRPGLWALALLGPALAALSKPTVAVVGAWALWLEWKLLGRSWKDPGVWRRVLPFAVAPHLVVWGTRAAFGGAPSGGSTSLADFAWAQPRVHLGTYLPGFLDPDRLHLALARPPGGPGDPWTWACLLVLVALVAWAVSPRSRPLPGFLLGAYAVMLAPAASFYPLPLAAAPYRPFEASPYLYALAAWALGRLAGRRVLLGVGVLAVALAARASLAQGRRFADPEAYWRHAIQQGASWIAYASLATEVEDPARRRELLVQALALRPEHALLHMRLGLAEVELGEVQAGLARCARAALANPHRSEFQFWFARALLKAGREAEARVAAEQALKLHGSRVEYRYLAGYLAYRAGDAARGEALLGGLVAELGGYRQAAEVVEWYRQHPAPEGVRGDPYAVAELGLVPGGGG